MGTHMVIGEGCGVAEGSHPTDNQRRLYDVFAIAAIVWLRKKSMAPLHAYIQRLPFTLMAI